MADDPLKVAAQQLEESARQLADLAALSRAANAQARADAAVARLHTPAARDLLEARADVEARQATARARVDAATSGARARAAESPLGQQRAQQQAQVEQQKTTSELRIETARMNAQARHFATPQGQAQLRVEQQARTDNERARQALQQARGEGPTMGDRFGRELTRATTGLGAFRGALGMVEGALMRFGGLASPTHAATLQSSFDLLGARVGQFLVPAMESAASKLQAVAEMLPDPRSTKGQALAESANLPDSELKSLLRLFGYKSPDEKLTYDLSRLPGGQISGAEQYADRLLAAGAGQTEMQAKRMQIELQMLEELKGINRRGQMPEDRIDPAFR